MSTRIGFIGCGRMAQALAKGFLEAKVATPGQLVGCDIAEAPSEAMRAVGVTVHANSDAIVPHVDVLIVAVKPQTIDEVLVGLRDDLTDSHLIISIAAGVTLERLACHLGESRRLIRVMPNTPCLVGEAASGVAAGPFARLEDVALALRLFGAVGVAHRVSEPLLDAVTGLSGSGPAYAYQVIEALSDGGVKVGLPREVATALAAQTLLGAAKMVLETGQHPGVLKDMVTSPAGTTIEGLAILEARGVRGALIDAVVAATRRAGELA